MISPDNICAHARLSIESRDPTLPGAFGCGVAQLLEGVRDLHSLNRAAKQMGMAYSKAWRIMKEAEAQVGSALILRDGARGSTLTEEGARLLGVYRTLQAEIDALIEKRLPELL